MKEKIIEDLWGAKTIEKAIELSHELNKEIFTLKDLDLSYKNVNDWDRFGLLFLRRDDASWRRFSLIDYLWIKVVSQFRTMGTPVPLIRTLREKIAEKVSLTWIESLIKENSEEVKKAVGEEDFNNLVDEARGEYKVAEQGEGLSIFHLLVTECILNKIPIALLLFENGEWFPFNQARDRLSRAEQQRLAFESYTSVPLGKIFKEFLNNDRAVFILPELKILEENEVRLLEIIHSGQYESITINFRNKKMKSLEMVKEQDVKRKVVDILHDSSYQDIVIKTHKGMVTKIQNTVKMML